MVKTRVGPVLNAACVLVLVLVWTPLCTAQAYLTELSLEELMSIEITSVSKKVQQRTRAAAAITVITQEDIQRIGATNIPDVLRTVPGIHLAKLDASKWSVTARGFSSRYSNKLLVFIDGRMMYSHLFAGTEWELSDVMLEDVDRIEIIRGPGSTLWGANAMNGVINIVTKNAANTQGGLVNVGGGTEEQVFTSIRYGGKIGDSAWYRVYAKFFVRDDGKGMKRDAYDQWYFGQGGFRIDWERPNDNTFTVQGDFFTTKLKQTFQLGNAAFPFTWIERDHSTVTAGNLLGRWNKSFHDENEIQLQLYHEYIAQDAPELGDIRRIWDIEFQQRVHLAKRHELVWGAGYRYSRDAIDSTVFASFKADKRDYAVVNAFVQDDITLIEDALILTLGSKFEYNDFSGFEYAPTIRLAYTPSENTTLWAAVSRSVRTPSRAETDARLNMFGLPLVLVELYSNGDFKSEDALSYEAGFRKKLSSTLYLDTAFFYTRYDHLRSIDFIGPRFSLFPWPPHITLPYKAFNRQFGNTYGAELALDWTPYDWWSMRWAYSYLNMKVENPGAFFLFPFRTDAGQNPQQMVSCRNTFTLNNNLELGLLLRYVDQLPSMKVGDYLEADLSCIWHLNQDVQISIVGQNLINTHHQEFSPAFVNTLPTEIQRSVYAKVSWRF